jgi:hypothetical protein
MAIETHESHFIYEFLKNLKFAFWLNFAIWNGV